MPCLRKVLGLCRILIISRAICFCVVLSPTLEKKCKIESIMNVLCLPENQVELTTLRNTISYFTRWTLALQNFDSLIMLYPLLRSLGFPEWERFGDKHHKSENCEAEEYHRAKRELSFQFPRVSGSPLRNHSTDVLALFLDSGTSGSGHTSKMQQFSECWMLDIFSKTKAWECKDAQIDPNWLPDIGKQGNTFLLLLANVFSIKENFIQYL